LAGTIVSGTIRRGEAVKVLPAGKDATVARIVTLDGDRDRAVAGEAVTLTISEDIDCTRGDMLAAPSNLPDTADQLEATLIWLSEVAMLPGRSYWLKLAGQKIGATVQAPKYRVNVDTLDHLAADALALNEIGVAHVLLDAPVAFEPYSRNRDLGGFILIDKLTKETVAAGLIHFALRRSYNVQWQPLEINQAHRARSKGQEPLVIWLTGLSGAGKSTIANLLEQRLARIGRHTYLLDGDNLRHGLNRDLGFSDADRIENVRRVGEVAKLMTDAGLIVLVAAISPFRAEREMVRSLFAPGEFLEVHVDVPLEVAEQRDPKGLYRKARAGSITNFTAINSPYERPERPEVHVDTSLVSAERAADLILAALPAGTVRRS
jgi:bifunctional enzyme CysN/CysC